VEGTATTVKSDVKIQPLFHAFKITANGKETDLTKFQGGKFGRGGMMGRGDSDEPFGPDQGPRN